MIPLLLLAAPFASAADDEEDPLASLREEAAQDRQLIDEIAAKSAVAVTDFAKLYEFIHATGKGESEVPSDALVQQARAVFAQLAAQSPAVFSAFVSRRVASLKTYPHVTAALILTAMSGAPKMIDELARENVIGDEAIDTALGDAPLSEKLKIVSMLSERGIRSPRIEKVLIEAVESSSISTELKTAAVSALAEIPTQESIDALWEIAGLEPSPDTKAVIAKAKEARAKLLKAGDFEDRSVTEKIHRFFTCSLRLIRK